MRIPTLVLCASLAACYGGDDFAGPELAFDPCGPLTIAPAGEMSEAEMASVSEAVAMWNQEAGTEIQFGEPELGDQVVAVRYDDAAPVFYGVYLDEIGEIIINHRLEDPEGRRITIAHELGHAFGLAHVEAEERTSLMNPGNLHTPITIGDLHELTARWGECP